MRLGKLAVLAATLLVVAAGTTAALAIAQSDNADGGGPIAGDCPVTRPQKDGFTPPAPYPATPSGPGMAWYGTNTLWTVLPVGGEYPPRKSVWWSSSFNGGQSEPEPEITVVWKRLDSDDPPITSGRSTNAHTLEDGWFMIAGIDPTVTGCWRVTATYHDAELSYIYRR